MMQISWIRTYASILTILICHVKISYWISVTISEIEHDELGLLFNYDKHKKKVPNFITIKNMYLYFDYFMPKTNLVYIYTY